MRAVTIALDTEAYRLLRGAARRDNLDVQEYIEAMVRREVERIHKANSALYKDRRLHKALREAQG